MTILLQAGNCANGAKAQETNFILCIANVLLVMAKDFLRAKVAKIKKEKGICARKGFVWAYMCLNDWENEAGFNAGGNHISYSVKALRRNRLCVESCGIVKVKVKFVKVIQEPKE